MSETKRMRWCVAVGVVVGLLAARPAVDRAAAAESAVATQAPEAKQPAEKAAKKPVKKKAPFAWQSLFDGKTLEGWKVPVFGGDGEVKVEDGAIVLGMGDPMTGIAWAGDKLPTTNYELALEAKRTRGIDFFATTTFPIGKSFASFVTGGWAGTVVGISCVDYYDAGDNITTQFKSFEDNTWYKIRIRVSDPKLECWIDDEKFVDLERKDRKFDLRIEVDLCKPLGIASYMTEGVVRKIRIRRLKPKEVEKIRKEAKERRY